MKADSLNFCFGIFENVMFGQHSQNLILRRVGVFYLIIGRNGTPVYLHNGTCQKQIMLSALGIVRKKHINRTEKKSPYKPLVIVHRADSKISGNENAPNCCKTQYDRQIIPHINIKRCAHCCFYRIKSGDKQKSQIQHRIFTSKKCFGKMSQHIVWIIFNMLDSHIVLHHIDRQDLP